MPELSELKLHPGAAVSLRRHAMDELDVAKAIAAGDLTSPQQYGNSWFFNIRVTGTGAAYRQALKEYVWRDSALYMTEHFRERCYGLPVIVEHPDTMMLDTKEYRARNIGTLVYPYLKKDEGEVWAVARVLDRPAAEYMRIHDLSTSPAVVFRDGEAGEKIELKDGKHLLIEDYPKLLDHIAIVDAGVWDKQGPPTGVVVTGGTSADKSGEQKMADEDKRKEAEDREEDNRDDRARADAEAGEKLDKLLTGLDSMGKRMDALEARHGRSDATAEEEAEQAAKLHQLAEEEEEESKEAAKGDSEEEDEEAKEKARKAAEEEDDERDDEDDGRVPHEETERKDGESDPRYSKRMDSAGRKYRDDRFTKRDDESVAAHCDRVARDARRDRARHDAEVSVARARKEAEEARADAAAARKDGQETRRLLEEMNRHLADRTPEDDAAFADAQARADTTYMALGQRAPASMRGESLIGYRARLARGLQPHSRAWKEEDLSKLARHSPSAFDAAETAVYADAQAASREPMTLPGGGLRQILRHREGGGEMYEWAGDPREWMQDFMPPAQMYAVRIGKEG